MIVLKFGGTSVGNKESLRQAIEVVSSVRDRHPVVVVSALAGVTDQLVEATRAAAEGEAKRASEIVTAIRERHETIARSLIGGREDFFEAFRSQLGGQVDQITDVLRGLALVGEVTPRARDLVVALGEKLSSVLFSYTLWVKKLDGVHVDSGDVIVTDDLFGEASPVMDETVKAASATILPELDRGLVPVMGGFFGRTAKGATATLGRGGSDYSASIVGAALGAEEIQIWKDVDGMMTCDPRVVPSARVLDAVSYDEAAELCYFGAKVLHPRALWPAIEKNIPVRVLNTRKPENSGTLITAEGKPGASGARAIALRKGVTVAQLSSTKLLDDAGCLAGIFEVFGRHGVSVDLVSTSQVSVSAAFRSTGDLGALSDELEEIAKVELHGGKALIAVVGRGVGSSAAAATTVLDGLRGVSFSMLAMGSSGLSLGLAVDQSSAENVVRSIHAKLFEIEGE